MLVLRMAHRIWKENKQLPCTAGPGNMLGCCLISFHFLWVILSTSTVLWPSEKEERRFFHLAFFLPSFRFCSSLLAFPSFPPPLPWPSQQIQ